MNFHSMLIDRNTNSDVFLAMLGLTQKDIGRYRGCFIHLEKGNEDPFILVNTRAGGGNRNCWDEHDEVGEPIENANSDKCDCCGCWITYKIKKHEFYLSDIDDDFDCTYAEIKFKCPDKFRSVLLQLIMGVKDIKITPGKKWDSVISVLERGLRKQKEEEN